MITHKQAKEICDHLPKVTIVESLFLRCVSLHETSYGGGWKPAKVKAWYGKPVSWTPGVTAPWNMGAITTTHPDELSFSHQDSRFDDQAGKVVQYHTWFAGDPTAAKGFERLRDTVLHANVRAALECQDFGTAVAAMHENSYFLGIHSRGEPLTDRLNVADYTRAVVDACHSIGAETGEVQPDVLPPKAAR